MSKGEKFPTFYPQSYPHKKGGKQWKEGVIHRVIHIVHKKSVDFFDIHNEIKNIGFVKLL